MKARNIFIILALINLLNYIDRQVLYSVFPLIKEDLFLSDKELGFLASAFMLVYMFSAPVLGYIADRTPRQKIIALSAFLWSIATSACACVRNYFALIFARSLVGVGESGFTSVCPSFIAEKFSPKVRARVLALFALGLPLGSALGYLLGGILGKQFGWRLAFLILGLPGIILAFIVYFAIKDTPKKIEEKPPFTNYLKLLKNKKFVFVCLAQAMGTFTLGALAAWGPSFLNRYFAYDIAKSGTIFGAIIIIAGALGTMLGGIIGDRWQKKTENGYFYTTALSYLIAFPFGILAFLMTSKILFFLFLILSTMFVFIQNGPLNASVVNLTKLKERSMAFALNVFIIHALGDAMSPYLVGFISDSFNLKIAVILSLFFVLPASLFAYLASKVK
jgi:Sugar phosphate permease